MFDLNEIKECYTMNAIEKSLCEIDFFEISNDTKYTCRLMLSTSVFVIFNLLNISFDVSISI